MNKDRWIIVTLCMIIVFLIVGVLAMRKITLQDNTISILNYHINQLQQVQQQQQQQIQGLLQGGP